MAVEELICEACGRLWHRTLTHGQPPSSRCPDCARTPVGYVAESDSTVMGMTTRLVGAQWGDLPRAAALPDGGVSVSQGFADCASCSRSWIANPDQTTCPDCGHHPGAPIPDDAFALYDCTVCRGPVLDRRVRPPDHPLSPGCDTGHVHHRGPHGLGIGLKHGCRCPECLDRIADTWEWVDRRVAGDTLEEIATDAGLTRERVRQGTAKIAPWAPWDAVDRVDAAERDLIADQAKIVDEAMYEERYCETCGTRLPENASSVQRFCRAACRERWDVLRWHIDPDRRSAHRRHVARWVVENPEGQTAEAVRYAERVLAGEAETYESRRWLIEGSKAWDAAVEAIVNRWPIADMLPIPVQRQVLEHLGHDAAHLSQSESDGGFSPYSDVLTKEFLRREYVEIGRSSLDIAEEIGCVYGTVLKALRRHGLPVRSPVASDSSYDDVLTEEFLRREYVENGRSGPDIADEVGCSPSAVYSGLHRHGIPTRGSDTVPGSRPKGSRPDYDDVLTEEFLHREYVDKRRSGTEIAAEVGCNKTTVYAALRRYGIDTHGGGSGRTQWMDLLTEEFLRREYVDHGRSGNDIAFEVGCSPSVVYAWLERRGIERRNAAETRTGPPNKWEEGWLRREYLERGRTASDIADEMDVATPTVYGALHRFGITRD